MKATADTVCSSATCATEPAANAAEPAAYVADSPPTNCRNETAALTHSLRDRGDILRRLQIAVVERLDEMLSEMRRACAMFQGHVSDNELLTSQVVPFLEAVDFARRNTIRVLKPVRLSRWGAPAWLSGVTSIIQRQPYGRVLIVGAANYPLFLLGVQAVQAFAAGNSILLKPAPGTEGVAQMLTSLLIEAGASSDVVRILPSAREAALDAIEDGVDLVVLTGSTPTGREIMTRCAKKLTPMIAELSGCDVMIVAPGADLERATHCAAFGLSIHGGATCCAPRRMLVHETLLQPFIALLEPLLLQAPQARLGASLQDRFTVLTQELVDLGGTPVGEARVQDGMIKPHVWFCSDTKSSLFQSDAFLPVAGLSCYNTYDQVIELAHGCPFALGASLFGSAEATDYLAGKLQVANIVVNDVIVPTADPRLPFPAWSGSGFGVTRGELGLLAMTRPQCLSTRRGRWTPHLEPFPPAANELFRGYLQWRFAGGVSKKIQGLMRLVKSAFVRSPVKHDSNDMHSLRQ